MPPLATATAVMALPARVTVPAASLPSPERQIGRDRHVAGVEGGEPRGRRRRGVDVSGRRTGASTGPVWFGIVMPSTPLLAFGL